MFKKIILALIVLLAGIAVFIASRPDDFRVERSILLNAPAPVVFEHINDLRKSNEWSPWTKIDPNMKQTYEGPAAGVGAKYAWAGNKDIGEGRLEIIESRPNELVRTNLEFLKPFKATNTADFTLVPQGGQTQFTWSMYGKSNFLGKAMSLVMNCDKMVGDQFEKGFASLKTIVEANRG